MSFRNAFCSHKIDRIPSHPHCLNNAEVADARQVIGSIRVFKPLSETFIQKPPRGGEGEYPQ